MKVFKVDIWDIYDKGYPVCITTNGVVKRNGALVMGRGVAKEAANRFKVLPMALGDLVKNHGNHVYVLNRNLISFPTKHRWQDYADVNLIRQSAYELLLISRMYKINQIVLPKPGCANGGLEWPTVERILEGVWKENAKRFKIVDKYE